MESNIVNSNWLYQHLDHQSFILLDASTASNVSGINVDPETKRIKHSRFFDLKKKFSKPNTRFPNMLPSIDQFEVECQNLGINRNNQIIVYDNVGIYNSPRVWWMFKTMGHDNIKVLNGGLPDWIKSGYEIEEPEIKSHQKGDFVVQFNNQRVKDFDFIMSNSKSGKELVFDARSIGRFNGTSPEPREGINNGAISFSVNLPFQDVLENGKLKSKQELAHLFNSVVSKDDPLIFSCGSGLTACIIHLAAAEVLENEMAVYDGSWTEWATKTQN